VQHVAPCRGQAVKQHERGAAASRVLNGERDAVGLHLANGRVGRGYNVLQISIFVRTRAIVSLVNSVVVECPPMSGVAIPDPVASITAS
jgi:hypothetical protein